MSPLRAAKLVDSVDARISFRSVPLRNPAGSFDAWRIRIVTHRSLVCYFERFDLPDLLKATAWRTRALKADSSTSSPSWMSIARRTLPSRLELKRRVGSSRDAPFAKVSLTTLL